MKLLDLITVICPSCGTTHNNEIQFCVQCGTFVGSNKPRYEPPPKESNPTPGVENFVLYNVGMAIIIILFFLII